MTEQQIRNIADEQIAKALEEMVGHAEDLLLEGDFRWGTIIAMIHRTAVTLEREGPPAEESKPIQCASCERTLVPGTGCFVIPGGYVYCHRRACWEDSPDWAEAMQRQAEAGLIHVDASPAKESETVAVGQVWKCIATDATSLFGTYVYLTQVGGGRIAYRDFDGEGHGSMTIRDLQQFYTLLPYERTKPPAKEPAHDRRLG